MKKLELSFLNDFFQENICSPLGLDCFRQIRPSNMCLPPCRGLYLDVNVDKNVPSIEYYPEFQPAYESYLKWKRGIDTTFNINHLTIFIEHILGRSYVDVSDIIMEVDLEGLKRHTELHWVHIHFNTPTFDRITRDEKANFVAKMSALGGTMGLLTGFSIISLVEIIFFGAKIFLDCLKTN